RYRDEISVLKKGRSSEIYRLNRLLKHRISERLVSSLKPSDFAAYRDERLKVISGDSVTRELILLSHLFEVARKDWSLATNNPVSLVKRPRANAARERRVSQLEADWIALHSNSAALGVALVLAVELGLRRSEIALLNWKNIDLAKRSLYLSTSKTGK